MASIKQKTNDTPQDAVFYVFVPPPGLEPGLLPPEGNALSTELWGPFMNARLSDFMYRGKQEYNLCVGQPSIDRPQTQLYDNAL